MTPAKLIAKLMAQGFTEWNSGGGCSAMRKDLPDNAYVLVTDLDASIPSGRSPFVVGYYVGDEQKLSEICGTPKEALDKAEIYCAIQRVKNRTFGDPQTHGSSSEPGIT